VLNKIENKIKITFDFDYAAMQCVFGKATNPHYISPANTAADQLHDHFMQFHLNSFVISANMTPNDTTTAKR